MPPSSTGSSTMHVPRRRTGPFGRMNSSTDSAISANGMSSAPRPISAAMPRCSHLSSTPSIGSSASRHITPSAPHIAPHAARESSGPSSCGSGARLLLEAVFVDFFVVVFLAANGFYPFTFFEIRHTAQIRPERTKMRVSPPYAEILQVYYSILPV